MSIATLLKTRLAYLDDARAVRAKRRAPCPVSLAHAAMSTCQTCGMYVPQGGFSIEELDVYREGWIISPAPNPLDAASVKANPSSKEHLEAERAWREACARLEAIDREQAAAFAAMHDPGERRVVVFDGGFVESLGERGRAGAARLEELKRQREDIEQDVQRARARVANHEAALDQRRLIWREKHRAEFERH